MTKMTVPTDNYDLYYKVIVKDFSGNTFLKKLAICIRRQTAPGGSHDFQLLYG